MKYINIAVIGLLMGIVLSLIACAGAVSTAAFGVLMIAALASGIIFIAGVDKAGNLHDSRIAA